MKKENNTLNLSCAYCGSTRLEANEDIVKCLDCGMGKYKKDKRK
jgi:ribosomal protein L37E